ncbi:MAG TPA: AraC family transcriptional regulator [Limnochordales bacterium]
MGAGRQFVDERRYDYWREAVCYYFQPEPSAASEPEQFQVWAKALIAPRGELYTYASGAPTEGSEAISVRPDRGDEIDIGLVLAGIRYHESDGEPPHVAGPGDAFVCDSAQASRVRWTAHRGVHLRLVRAAVESALGGALPPAGVLAGELGKGRLWPFLRDHLSRLADEMSSLSRLERSLIMDQTVDLALAALRVVGSQWHGADPSAHGLFVIAHRFIAQHLGEPDLSVKRIARALGCSRATLYRLFAHHRLTVAAYIRERRMQWLYHLLLAADNRASWSALAERCGFRDLTNLPRRFRRRFGLTPSQLRERARRSLEAEHPV